MSASSQFISGVSGVSATTNVLLTPEDTEGGTYSSGTLIGKTAMVDFNIFSNDGNGSLLQVDTVYLFDSGTGTITITEGSYLLQIY